MAKKTSYLTELIERHERWKAEGGDRQDEEDHHSASDLYVGSVPRGVLFIKARWNRPASGDPEDLWDFGTVRHAATVGRSQNQIHVSGPPLTWENNGTRRSDSSSGSGGSYISTNSSITVKGELPPLPASPASARRVDQQATVRHMPEGAGSRNSHHSVQREPSDEYDDDYDDDPYSDTYTARGGSTTQLSEKMSHVQLEDDLPDTTMLDSVILPAIASVSLHS